MNSNLPELIKQYIHQKKVNGVLPSGFWNKFSEELCQEVGFSMSTNACRKMMKRRYEEFGNKLTTKDVTYKLFGDLGDVQDEQLSDTVDYIEDNEPPSTVFELSNDKYFYDETTGNYVIPLKSAPKPLIISNENLKLIKRRYSNWDGVPSSINEICRDFQIPRGWFNELKNIMGWTHDSEPYLESEVLNGDGDQLIEETLQERRRILYQKFEKRKWEEIKRDAEKFQYLEQTFFIPLREKISEALPKYTPLNINLGGTSSKTQKYALVFAPMDIHVGKLPYILGGYDPNKFDTEVVQTIEELFSTIAIHGKPEKIIAVSGSDMFHIDTATITTTKGTPQGGQTLGSHYDVIVRGYKLGFQIWDFLMDFCGSETHLHTLHVAGNHDKSTSLQFALALEQRYQKYKNFEVDYSIHERKFSVYEDNLIIATHGEYMKTNNTSRNADIMSSILVDSRNQRIDISKIKNFLHFSGHIHKTVLSNHNEESGILDITVPSLAVTDFFHHQNGYEGNLRRVSAYRIKPEHGISGIDIQSVI